MTQEKAAWLDRDGQPISTARAEAAGERQREMTRRTLALLAAAGEAVAEPGWYALTVRDGSERTIGEALDRAGWSTWVATEKVRTRRRRRSLGGMSVTTVEVTRAIFGGYVFTRLRWCAEACHWFRGVDGVFGIVGGWESPVAIGEHELVRVKSFFDKSAAERKKIAAERLRTQMGIQPGDTVLIARGPFATFEATVLEDADAVGLWVETMLFGRAARMRIDLADLSRIGVSSRP